MKVQSKGDFFLLRMIFLLLLIVLLKILEK